MLPIQAVIKTFVLPFANLVLHIARVGYGALFGYSLGTCRATTFSRREYLFRKACFDLFQATIFRLACQTITFFFCNFIFCVHLVLGSFLAYRCNL